jgi:curved DNA-binding protein CbpA
MRRANAEALHRPFRNTRRDAEREVRTCDHPDCAAEGSYRAPRDPNNLTDYYWFCLDHVRQYNRAWNYFEGLSEDEIERIRRRDTTWNRPSWPFGSVGQRPGPGAFRDDFGFFDEEQADAARERMKWERARQQRDAHERRRNRHKAPGDTPEEQALAELELTPPVSFAAIKARYKELVKRLHPDVNGGDRSQEDRLKTVNQAYATLRAAYARY